MIFEYNEYLIYLNLILNIVYMRGFIVEETQPDQRAISPNQNGGTQLLNKDKSCPLRT